jgi:Tfp pilus assembly protein PilN
MVNAEIKILEGRNKFLSKEIQKNNARITQLEEFGKS